MYGDDGAYVRYTQKYYPQHPHAHLMTSFSGISGLVASLVICLLLHFACFPPFFNHLFLLFLRFVAGRNLISPHQKRP